MAIDKSQVGNVKVVNNRYKVDGVFHRLEKNSPIFDEDGNLCGTTNPRDMTYIHTYGGDAPFFEGLGKGKIIAAKCTNDKCPGNGSVHMPFRIHCPDCLEKMEHVDITNVARETSTVHSFMITERTGAFNTLKKPIQFVNVEFNGVCTILMSYLPVGKPEMGIKLVPIFKTKNPDYLITDLAFVPVGTDEKDLPEGFTFG